METKQLRYFLAACRTSNNATAADQLKIAASTLSSSLAQLELELGVDLLNRAADGYYPTKAARLIYCDAELILQSLDHAREVIVKSDNGGLLEIPIFVCLKFSFGAISTALNRTISAMLSSYPDVRFRVIYQQVDAALQCEAHINVDYCTANTGSLSENLVFEDEWCLVSNVQLGSEGQPDVIDEDRLRQIVIEIPDLPDSAIEGAVRYCQSQSYRTTIRSEVEVGSLPRWMMQNEERVFLIPLSVLSDRLRANRMFHYALPDRPKIKIHATPSIDNDLTRSFVIRLRKALAKHDHSVSAINEITLRQVKYFLRCYEHQNITVAADRLCIAQPALSNQLRLLEGYLQAKLFERSSKGLIPTPAGKKFFKFARVICAAMERIEKSTKRLSDGKEVNIRIGLATGLMGSNGLAALVSNTMVACQGMFPDAMIHVFEAPQSSLEAWLRTDALDVAVLDNNLLILTKDDVVAGEQVGLVSNGTAPNLTFASSADAMHFVLPEEGFRNCSSVQNDLMSRVGGRVVYQVDSFSMALEMVKLSGLVSIMPWSAAKADVEAGNVSFAAIDGVHMQRNIDTRRPAQSEQHPAKDMVFKSLRDSIYRFESGSLVRQVPRISTGSVR